MSGDVELGAVRVERFLDADGQVREYRFRTIGIEPEAAEAGAAETIPEASEAGAAEALELSPEQNEAAEAIWYDRAGVEQESAGG